MPGNTFNFNAAGFPFVFLDGAGNSIALDPMAGMTAHAAGPNTDFALISYDVGNGVFVTFGGNLKASKILGNSVQLEDSSGNTVTLSETDAPLFEIVLNDGTNLTLSGGVLKINGSPVGGGSTQFNSAPLTLNEGASSYKVAHGLASKPTAVWAELVCISADANWGMAIGDSIDVESIFNPNNNDYYDTATCAFAIFWDATYVEVACETLVGNETDFKAFRRGGTGVISPSSFANFKLVLHAR